MAVLSQAYVCLLLAMAVLCHAARPTADHAMGVPLGGMGGVPLGGMGEDNGLWYTPPVPVGSWHHGLPPYAGGGGGGGGGSGYSYPPYNGGGGIYSYPPYNGGGNGRNYDGTPGCEAPGRCSNCGCGCSPSDSWPGYSGNGLAAKKGNNMAEKNDAEGGHSPVIP